MGKKKIVRFLMFSYVLLVLLIVVLAARQTLQANYAKQKQVMAEQLLLDAISAEHYITTDQLSDKIINQDPSFLLVDVREVNDFKQYSLPNALNIPLSILLNEEFKSQLIQDQFDIIFFSNDNLLADQTWFLCNQKGLKNMSVLKGGLNEWFETIINPKIPEDEMPQKDFSLFDTRKAASMYFGVEYPAKKIEIIKKKVKPVPKKVETVKKKKKRPMEGGC